MNAGGHGSDMAAACVRYRWVDLLGDGGGTDDVGSARTTAIAARPCARPRWSSGGPRGHARCRPTRNGPASATSSRWRREHQPGGSNAGSVFTNPPGDSAGRLIEAAGLKGFRLGHGAGLGEACQFHPGRQGRAGRTTCGPSWSTCAPSCRIEQSGCALRAEVRLLGFDGGETGAGGSDGGRRAMSTARRGEDAPERPGPDAGAGWTRASRPGGPPSPASRDAAACTSSSGLLVVVLAARRDVVPLALAAVLGPEHQRDGDPTRRRPRSLRRPGLANHPPLLDVDAGQRRPGDRAAALGAVGHRPRVVARRGAHRGHRGGPPPGGRGGRAATGRC